MISKIPLGVDRNPEISVFSGADDRFPDLTSAFFAVGGISFS